MFYFILYRNEETGDEVEVHTNTIEGAWAHAKNHFKFIHGTNVRNFEGHLAEILWRNYASVDDSNIYDSFFKLITDKYTLDSPPEFNLPAHLFGTWNPNFVDKDGVDRSIVQQMDDASFHSVHEEPDERYIYIYFILFKI